MTNNTDHNSIKLEITNNKAAFYLGIKDLFKIMDE